MSGLNSPLRAFLVSLFLVAFAVACGQTSHARRYQGSYCQKAICKAAVRPIAVIGFVRCNSIPGPIASFTVTPRPA